MKLKNTTKEIRSVGVQETGKFQISANAKAFKILSDGLYSNKPLAIIRELSANAKDAHAAAGNEDKPFKVHLPNEFEPWLEIRDYGTGLSHEDIMHLYVTYFDSTKTDSNDYVGALGLGSKSPFSYVDSFTVTSYFNGQKRVYAAAINAAGPEISLMGEPIITEEPNGLCIKMQVKPVDINRFIKAAQQVYAFFDVLPIITGNQVQITNVVYQVKSDNWAIIDRQRSEYSAIRYRTHGMYAIMGNIAYPVSIESLENYLDEHEKEFIRHNYIDMFFDLGELDIAASRESLSYDQDTIFNIVNRIKDVMDEVTKWFYEELDQKKYNRYSKWKWLTNKAKLSESNSSHIRTLALEQLPKTKTYKKKKKKPNIMHRRGHRGSDIVYYSSYDNLIFCGLDSYDLTKTNLKTEFYNDVSIDVDSHTIFVIDNYKKKNWKQRVKHWWNTNAVQPYNIYIIKYKDFRELKRFFRHLGYPPKDNIFWINNFEDPPKNTSTNRKSYTSKSVTDTVRKITWFDPKSDNSYVDRTYYKKWFSTTEEDYDLSNGGVCIKTHGYNITHTNHLIGTASKMQSYAQLVPELFPDKIFIVNGKISNLKVWPKVENKFVNLEDYIKDKLKTSNQLISKEEMGQINLFDFDIYDMYKDVINFSNVKVPNKLGDEINAYVQLAEYFDIDLPKKSTSTFNADVENKKMQTILNKYPLLELLMNEHANNLRYHWKANATPTLQQIKDYVELVDNK